MEVEITTIWQVLDKILHIKQVSSRSSGVWQDVQNLQIPLTLAASTWGSVFPARGKSIMAEYLLPLPLLAVKCWSSSVEEQQLHARTICFPVNMALVQGCFPVSLVCHIQENEAGWTHVASVTPSPQESGTLPRGSCFQGTDVSWKQAVAPESVFCCPSFVTPSSSCLNPDSLRHADLWKWASIAVYHRQLLLQEEEGKDSALRKGNWYASAWKDEKDLIHGTILVFHQCFCYISFFWPLCNPLSLMLL